MQPDELPERVHSVAGRTRKDFILTGPLVVVLCAIVLIDPDRAFELLAARHAAAECRPSALEKQ